MIRAVIFDLDGTVADTVSAIREGLNLTMERSGYPTHDDSAVRSFLNNGARELIRRAIPEEYRSDEGHVSRVLADYDRDYASVYDHTDRPYDGMCEVVRALHEMGLRIAVLSNKQDLFVKGLAQQLLPCGCVDVAQGVVKGKPTKPDPYLTCLVAEQLGVLPDECVVVGDSDVDVRTAKNAGMAHIGVSWGYRDEAFLREHGATRIADTPAQLLEMIRNLVNERGA